MTFFYDLNKRLAALANKQDAKQISEDVKASAPKSKLAESLEEIAHDTGKKLLSKGERSSLAKQARAGKDIGKPGKGFKKVAASAAKRYGSKEAGERVAAAAMFKQAAKHEGMYEAEGTCNECGMYESKCECTGMEEGNAFTGKLASTPKGSTFKLGNKEFKDTSSLEEQEMDEGYAEMDAWLKSREKEKGTGRYDKKKISTGTVYTRKPETFDEPETDPEATGGAPKRRGRPMGKPKGPERVTAKSYKYKSGRPVAEELPPGATPADAGEYSREGDAAKDDIHTIVRHARALEKILGDNEDLPEWVQAKLTKIQGMMVAVDDYMQTQHERDSEEMVEKAPPGAKAERMVKNIKKAYSKDGKLTPKEKAIAYATTWKAKKAGKVEEESKPDFLDVDKDGNKKETFKKAAADNKAERAGKKVAKDIEYDEKKKDNIHGKKRGSEDAKAERAGKKVAKDIEYDEKVDETTTSGSVATAPSASKSNKGMQFGKGVYEGVNARVENMIAEGMNVTVNMNSDAEGDAQKSITVTATGQEADKLAELLKMAGLEQKKEVCPGCGSTDCGCEEELDENSPDWPTNTDTLDAEPNLRTYSGGLNGPKSTGQTTIPVIASQARRQGMEENVELERNLFKTWTNYKG